MSDAEYDLQRARIKGHIDRWHGRLLTEWRVRYQYDRTGEQMPTDGVREGYTVLAHTEVNWPFRRARITFNVAAVADVEDDQEDDLEEQVVHEMCHVLLDELAQGDERPDAGDHLEHAVTTMARACIGAAKA